MSSMHDPSAQPVGQMVYAGFGARFLAFLIDGILVGIVSWLLTTLMGTIGQTLGTVVTIAYWVGMTATRGQTLGKMMMGIKVVRADGSPVSWGTSIVRYIGYIISSIILLIGFIMAAFTERKRALHDMIAGTVVIKV